MLIVASSGYCVYGALLPNTATSRTRRDLQHQLFALFSKTDFPVAFFLCILLFFLRVLSNGSMQRSILKWGGVPDFRVNVGLEHFINR